MSPTGGLMGGYPLGHFIDTTHTDASGRLPVSPPADDVRELIAEARRFQSFKTFQYPETDLIRRLADALEVHPRGTVTPPADDVRIATIRAFSEAAYGTDPIATRADRFLRDFEVHPRGTVTDAEAQWEYGIRASGDDEPYSDVSEDVDWLIDHFTVGVPDEQIVRRRKAGPWEVRT